MTNRLENFSLGVEAFCNARGLDLDITQERESRSVRVHISDGHNHMVHYLPIDDVQQYPFTQVFVDRLAADWRGVREK